MAAEKAPVLVVDDEPMLLEALSRTLKHEFDVDTASDGPKGLDRLGSRRYKLMLTDIAMPGMTGLELLGAVKQKWPDTEVIVMTGHGTIDTAVDAMKRGAFDFLQKPFESLDHVLFTARRAIERHDLRAQNAELLDKLRARPTGLIGSSAPMRAIHEMVPDLARSDAAVLIEGESGTGKEVLARAIHGASPRAAKPFVPVNCGAIPETMIESELFGHEKGAFTGAIASARGLFRAADGGTIFLDEIGEIPLAMQVKLLRALQEQEVRPVGSTQTVKVDVRVIAATNRDLRAMLAAGKFREDLYYRLAVVPVKVPALRERREDIAALVRHFVRKLNAAEPQPKFEEIDPAAMDRLSAWNWPGNVRELENVIERAFALGKPGRLGVQHLPEEISRGAAASRGKAEADELTRIPLSLEAFEKFCLQRALDETGGDATKAATLLGLPRSTFYRRLQRLGLKSETSKK